MAVGSSGGPHNVTINGLLPGQYNTDRIGTIIANTAKIENISPAAACDMLGRNPTKRLGEIVNLDLLCVDVERTFWIFNRPDILIDGGSLPSLDLACLIAMPH